MRRLARLSAVGTHSSCERLASADVRLITRRIGLLVKCGDVLLETLPLADALDEFFELAALVERRALHELPVVEDKLRERLSGRRLAELACSTASVT